MNSGQATSEEWDRKRVLVVWYTNPNYIPPFRLSERQVTVGVPYGGSVKSPHYDALLSRRGTYDLAEELSTAGIDKAFDLIVVWSDATRSNFPFNLEAFDCPKVLGIGDTHHLKKPLQCMLNYAREADYDFVVSSCNRQHLHWFVEDGHDCAWIPALKSVHIPTTFVEDREPCVAFLGQVQKFHPRRVRLLEAIKSNAIPLRAKRGTREIGAALYASSMLSFNASLNGDLNMRIFEVLSAAGCLVTDRLSSYSGLDELFEEDREIICYNGVEDLLETVDRCLAEPKIAFEIAKAGHRRFMAEYMPRMQRDVLFNWVFRGELEQRYRASADPRTHLKTSPRIFADRVELYEGLQEFHRVKEQPRVIVSSRIIPSVCSDSADLPRLQISQLTSESARQEVDGGILRLSEEQASEQEWDIMIVAPGEQAPAGISAAQLGHAAHALVKAKA